ncbi:hypothetical protein PN36_20070 [Candidatus Thiomargarita nelsonii]|uniref:Type I restriction enzyme R protein N-terminal domain-containing protein n=1 Tax=Candidatus Thiomargarita nelsonii TaxID=1003181 RepID=A0A4E0QU58_9GAMM|nr:hypothetical protein PN36_20070 [Candidatus Thiomargarita nelsonii]
MSYGKFKSVEEVATKFDIKVADRTAFLEERNLEILDAFLSMVAKNLVDDTNYVTEFAVCDAIIRPIIGIVAENYNLKVWSHVSYNVDEEKGLVGEPDYLIAPKTKYGAMARPSLCVIEAKKDDFDDGWAQALSEMVASSLLGTHICYGIVTTGAIWQFGKLEKSVFVIDSRYLSATTELQRVFNTINWIFQKIS